MYVQSEVGSAVERLIAEVAELRRSLDGRLEGLADRRDAAGGLSADDDADSAAAGPRRITRPALPDARLVRHIIRQRRLRARFFDEEMFADPAWDMLLDLTAARVEHRRVSITSLCIAANVPTTTALRWIGIMSSAGIFERVEDDCDRRRTFIGLTDKAADVMARYFDAAQWRVSALS